MKNLTICPWKLCLFVFLSIGIWGTNNIVVQAVDICAEGRAMWTRDYPSTGKWASYGKTPSDVGFSRTNLDNFCPVALAGQDFWPRSMWHNDKSWLMVKCVGVGCGFGFNPFGRNCTFPSKLLVSQNGEYDLCVPDRAGRGMDRTVFINWIDTGKPKIVNLDPICTVVGGGKDGQIYHGEWLGDGGVKCNFSIVDTAGHGTDLPVGYDSRGRRTAQQMARRIFTPKASGLKKFQFEGDAFDSITDPSFKKGEDMLTVDPNNPEKRMDLSFTFTQDILLDTTSQSAQLVLTDYAGNHNDDQTLAGWEVRIDRNGPTFDGVDCYSGGNQYTGEDTANFPNGWSKNDVDCSYTVKDTASKVKSWQSTVTALNAGTRNNWPNVNRTNQNESLKVENFIYTSEQNQKYKIEGKAKDNAGNESIMNLPNYKIKIDKQGLQGTNIKMKSMRPGDTDSFRTISSNAGNPTRFEAHEKFAVDLGIVEPTVNESAIDWDNSWISIRHTAVGTATDLGPWIQRPLSDTSFGMTFDRGAQLLYFLDPSDVFEQAGRYHLQFHIVDEAGNEQSPAITERYVQIVPSEISGTNAGSTLTDQTVASETYANNADIRTLELSLRDRFDNIISNRIVEVTIPGQDLSAPSYDLTKNNGVGGLEEGLSFATGSPTALRYTATGTRKYFTIKSYLPSLDVEFSADGKGAIMIEKKDAAGRLIGQDVSFEVVGPIIKPNGYPSGVNQPPALFETPVLFRPIVYGYLVNRHSGDGATIPYLQVKNRMTGEHIELVLGQEFPFFGYTNTGVNAGGFPTGRPLPRNYEVEIQAHAKSGLGFSNEDYLDGNTGERTIDFCPTNNCVGFQKSELSQTYPERSGGRISTPVFALSSKIHVFLGGKRVTYPGGNLGNNLGNGDKLFDDAILCPDGTDASCPDWFNHADIEIITIEADVEGSILGEEYSFTQDASVRGGDSKIVAVGGVSAKDIREDITRNAYQLVRNLEAESVTDLRTGVSFSSAKPVRYIKGDGSDIFLGGIVSGVGTLVIEDANLVITDDMSYATSQDSLGVILINSTTTRQSNVDGPLHGNIYITKEVQNIVGTYFADGSIMSVKPTATGFTTDLTVVDRRSLVKQLLINGTIFTKNTLGGVLSEISGAGDNMTPWGTVPNTPAGIQTAMKYDLHWLRRYRPNSGAPYKNPATNSNEHATVIRPDGKVRSITPPGFNIGTLIKR